MSQYCALGLLLLAAASAAGQTHAAPVRSNRVRQLPGETKTLRVPMVAEPWAATAGRVSAPRQPIPWDMGHFAGFEEAKREANARRKAWKSPKSRQPSAHASAGAALVFDGPGELATELIPPDPQIAAGPVYLVVAVNSLLSIYDKSGNLKGSFQDFSSFFSGLGITGQIFDPRIIYDQADQRYIFSAGEIDFTNLTNGHVLLAVSSTNDPTQTWYKFAIDFKGRNAANTQDTFPDFPGLGLSPSAVYLTTNQFELTQSCISTDAQECFFSDTWIEAVALPALLSGNSNLTITKFTNLQTATGFPAFSIQPALSYGAPSAEFMVAAEFSSYTQNTLNLFALTTSGTPELTTADLTVPQFSLPPYAVQAGTSNGIITDDFRPLNAVWANGSLWFAQTATPTEAPAVAAQWYEISMPSLASASLAQSGSVYGSGEAFYPGVSIRPDGTVAMAFTTASEFEYASAAFTSRAPTDPLGTMRGYAIYRAGLDRYDEPEGNRWGDFSGVSVDPDDNSFWTIVEYANTPDPNFGTAVAQVTGAPALSVSPALLDFKNVPVGQPSSPQSVIITNTSSASVTLAAISVGGPNAADFAIATDACSNASLTANQTCTVSLVFTPSINNTETALLSIPYNGSNLITLAVTGYGILQAVLSFNPAQLTFPATVQQSASAPLVTTLSNTGNTPAEFGTIAGGIVGDFTQTNNCTGPLLPGTSCQFAVTFRPTNAGFQRSYFGVGYPGGQSGNLIISGTGVTAPAAGFCPGAVTFSDQAIQSTSAAQTVIFTNTGSDTLIVSKISAAGDFDETDNCVGGLPPRTSCTINVSFKPGAAGTRNGSITVIDNAPGSPQTISLSGTGVVSAADVTRPPAAVPRPAAARQTEVYRSRSLEFERNDGQFDPGVEFVARADGHSFAVSRNRVMIRTGSGEEDTFMALANASPDARPSGSVELPGTANYFVGNEPSRWRTNVPLFAKVETRDVYPGIDLVYYGSQRQLEYDFVVAPGANPNAIALRFEPQAELRIAESGELVVDAPGGGIRFHQPVVYQEANEPSRRRESIAGRYILLPGNEVGFEVGRYDRSRTLIIDPVLSFSTYLAGSTTEAAGGVALDSAGNAYVIGTTYSTDFPVTAGAFQSTCGRIDYPCNPTVGGISEAFVSKLAPSGSLIYSTYLGGGLGTQGFAIAVDASGNAYVTGSTTSQDFPITLGAFQAQCRTSPGSPCASAFVTKLNPAGSALVYSTYLGGTPAQNSPDQGRGIGVDSSGNALVGGVAGSLDFPTTPGALQTTATPYNSHGFVTKLNPAGTALVYSTYLGGTNIDTVTGIAVDATGNAYVAGRTDSLDFPTLSAYQAGSYNGNSSQAFVSKFSPTGALAYSTYLGGSDMALATGIAIDSTGAAYVTGNAALGQGFPLTQGTLVSTDSGGGAFVTKVHPQGCALLYSTFLPVTPSQATTGIALDSAADAYVGVQVSGGVFPLVNTLEPPLFGSFVTEIDPKGAAVLFSTDFAPITGIAVDAAGGIYVTGTTNAPDFPVASALEPTCPSCENHGTGVFVSKIGLGQPPPVTLTRPSLTFAARPVNYCCDPEVQSVGLMNNLSTPLAISAVNISGASFSSATYGSSNPIPCTGTIAPGTGCVVQVQFAASGIGPQSGALTISDDGPGSPRTVSLNGLGLTDFGLSSEANPGPLAKGTASTQFTIYVATIPGAPTPAGEIQLNCAGVAPAACSFAPATIDYSGNGQSTLTVSGLSAVAGYSLSFSVVGTLAGQTYNLPLSISFQSALGAVVSAADYAPALAPESIATAFGVDLAASPMSATALPLPTLLNGTTVAVTDSDGVEHIAPLFYVSPGQVNFEVPAGTVTGPATVTIGSGGGAVSTGVVSIASVGPTLFSANADGKGPVAGFAIYVAPDGAQTSALLAAFDPASQKQGFAPIDLGQAGAQVYLSLFGTGIRGLSALANATATVGGTAVPVTYAGAQGGFVGLDQVNLGPLPLSLMGTGVVDIVLIVDGQSANTLQIQIQ